MTDERIEKIKSAVEAADHIPADKKAELLALLANLKPAIAKVAETHPEDAQNIGHSVEASAQIAARENKRPERLEKAVRELKQSVEKFEASHPDLAAFVNRYSTLLSALGF
jgi:ABC-type transporter Mla subunit MlaD